MNHLLSRFKLHRLTILALVGLWGIGLCSSVKATRMDTEGAGGLDTDAANASYLQLNGDNQPNWTLNTSLSTKNKTILFVNNSRVTGNSNFTFNSTSPTQEVTIGEEPSPYPMSSVPKLTLVNGTQNMHWLGVGFPTNPYVKNSFGFWTCETPTKNWNLMHHTAVYGPPDSSLGWWYGYGMTAGGADHPYWGLVPEPSAGNGPKTYQLEDGNSPQYYTYFKSGDLAQSLNFTYPNSYPVNNNETLVSNTTGVWRWLNITDPGDATYLRLDTANSPLTGNLSFGAYHTVFSEITTPSTPAADTGQIYFKDDGSGESAPYAQSDAGIEYSLVGGGGGATDLPALTDVDDNLLYTDGLVLRANGTEYTGAQLNHSDLSFIGTINHTAIDNHILTDTTVHENATNLVHISGTESITGLKNFDTTLPESSLNPTQDDDLVRKGYVDPLILGLSWKEPVLDMDLSTDPAGNTTGDRYCVNTTGAGAWTGMDEELVEWNGGSWVSDGAPQDGWAVLSVDDNKQWRYDAAGVDWIQVGGGQAYTASLGVQLVANDFRADLLNNGGINLTGNSLFANTDNSSVEKSAGGKLQVKALGVTNAMLQGLIADTKLLTITTAGKVNGTSIVGLPNLPGGAGLVPTANLGSGAAGATTFLRGDQTWAIPAGVGQGAVNLSYTSALNTNTTAVNVTNTVVETEIYNFTVPANTLSTNKALRAVVTGTYRNFVGANRAVTVRMKYGATTLCTKASGNIGSNTNIGNFAFILYLTEDNITNDQQGYMSNSIESGADVSTNWDDRGRATIDSTAAQRFVVSVQHSGASALTFLNKKFAHIELLNANATIGSPTDAAYVVMTADGRLEAERVATNSSTVNFIDGGANGTLTWNTVDNTSQQWIRVWNTSTNVGRNSEIGFNKIGNVTVSVTNDTTLGRVNTSFDVILAKDLVAGVGLSGGEAGSMVGSSATMGNVTMNFDFTELPTRTIIGADIIPFATLGLPSTHNSTTFTNFIAQIPYVEIDAYGNANQSRIRPFYNAREMVTQKDAGAATVSTYGFAAPVLLATAASNDGVSGPWLKHNTTATINTTSGVNSSAFTVTRRDWNPEYITRVLVNQTAITSVNYQIGLLSQAALLNTTNWAGVHCALFDYDTEVAGGANYWRLIQNDGGASPTIVNTTVAIVAGGMYNLKIVCNSTGDTIDYYINNTLAPSGSVSTDLPTSTTLLGYENRVTNRVAALRELSWERIVILEQ